MEAKIHAQFYRTQPEITLAKLAKFIQEPTERAKDYISWFKLAKQRCRTEIFEGQFINLCLNGLGFELRMKFEGMEFMTFQVTH